MKTHAFGFTEITDFSTEGTGIPALDQMIIVGTLGALIARDKKLVARTVECLRQRSDGARFTKLENLIGSLLKSSSPNNKVVEVGANLGEIRDLGGDIYKQKTFRVAPNQYPSLRDVREMWIAMDPIKTAKPV